MSQKRSLHAYDDIISFENLLSGWKEFLGWVHFPHHRVLKTNTKKRMFKRVQENPTPETIQSYKALLKHGNAYRLENRLEKTLIHAIIHP